MTTQLEQDLVAAIAPVLLERAEDGVDMGHVVREVAGAAALRAAALGLGDTLPPEMGPDLAVDQLPRGLAVYVRRMSTSSHGTPAEFAARMKACGLRWIALAGPWHELRDGRVRTGMMNPVERIHAYGDALEDAGIQVYVWGYPWLGHSELFVEQIAAAAKWGRVLLDPELGANPSKAATGSRKALANAEAELVVRRCANAGVKVCGLSTFGNGYRIGWFPLVAYARALAEHFPGRSFIGGQTYTSNDAVDPSKADMLALIARDRLEVELVPNFGLYKRVGAERTVKRRTARDLLEHLQEFVDDPVPVRALIGWAENFLHDETEKALSRFDDAMEW
ncbi:MAG: hypothetical protein JJ863_21280 [Deltaproteobacteria bacterium]|nr:hypothetical protein [Deltaproteobacteria bacterium]